MLTHRDTSLLSVALLLGMTLEASAAVSFQAVQRYSVGTNPTAVVTADFNRDGKPDLAVVNNSSNNISVLLGKGDGTFSAANNFDAGSGPNSLAVGDFDGDGQLDLAVLVPPASDGSSPGEVRILLGNGDGTFQAPRVAPLGNQETALAVADVNGDKKADLLVSLPDGTGVVEVGVRLGNGDGTFQASKTVMTNQQNILAIADFNGDGKLDLAIAVSGATQILLGQGDGTFSPSGIASLTGGYNANSAWTVDLNNDGKLDLVISSTLIDFGCRIFSCDTSQNVSLFLGRGDGTFGSEQIFATGSAGGSIFHKFSNLVTDIASGDFNGDGNLDIAGRGGIAAPKALVFYLGNGRGILTALDATDPGGFVLAADLNGDQLTDLIQLDSTNNSVGVLLNSTPAFSMKAAHSALTAQAGGQVTDGLSFTPVNGFSSSVQLSCLVTGPAPAPTCSFSPANITPGGNTDTSTLTIDAPANSAALVSPPGKSRRLPLWALGLPFPFLGFAQRRKWAPTGYRGWLLAAVLAAATLLCAACGGGSTQLVHQSQSYTVQVTAASDSLTRTTQISLTVQ